MLNSMAQIIHAVETWGNMGAPTHVATEDVECCNCELEVLQV